MKAKVFLKKLDNTIEQHSMLTHQFYEMWNRGELPLKTIQEYSKQYFAQVHAFPTYVSAVHSHCDDLKLRQILLENLVEEEADKDNHPELWLRFAEGLGVSRKEVENANLLPKTRESVKMLKSLTQSENYLEGLAALYAYESQIPEVSQTKREGLKRFYGIDDDRTVSFFTVHEVADPIHRKVEQDILKDNCTTDEVQEKVLDSAEKAAKALRYFLDGVYSEFVEA